MDDPAVPIKEEPMKQENINSFNIPDTSIIDDVPTEQQTVNPGFMDINKIEETATDTAITFVLFFSIRLFNSDKYWSGLLCSNSPQRVGWQPAVL